MTTSDLITAMTAQMDSLRALACALVTANHPQQEALDYHAEQLYGAAACLESWIDGLLEAETTPEGDADPETQLWPFPGWEAA